MADIRLRTIVDLDLAAGKINADELMKALPKLVEQSFARLPGTKPILRPDIEVKPRFNIARVRKEIEGLLKTVGKSGSFEGVIPQKEIEKATFALQKYADVLRQMESLEAGGRQFTRTTIQRAQQVADGDLDFTSLRKRTQDNVRQYREYISQVQRTHQEMTNSFSQFEKQWRKVYDEPIRLLQEKTAKLRKSIAQLKADIARGIENDISASSLENMTRKLQRQQLAVEANMARVAELRAAPKPTPIGALGPQISTVLSDESKLFAKNLGKAISGELAREQEKSARRQVQTMDQAQRDDARRQARQIQEQRLRLNQMLQAQLEDLSPHRGMSPRDRAFAVLRAQAEEINQRIDARRGTDARRMTRAMEDARAEDLQRTQRAQFLEYGRARLDEYGGVGAAHQVPQAEAIPVREFVKQRIEDLKRQQAGVAANSRQYRELTHEIARHDKAMRQLNDTIQGTHSFTAQLGYMVRQFLRYAVGYASLYVVLRNIRQFVGATIDLEDRMKRIQAITASTNAEMNLMGETIKRTAQTTRFRLGEISEAVLVVAQAGTAIRDIPKTVAAVANLATGTGTTLKTAADIITTVQNVWSDLEPTQIANQITKVANVSKIAVENLQTILSFGASFAKNVNLGLDQFLGVAATLRNAGVRPSTIGTGSGQLFLELFAPDEKTLRFLQQRYAMIGEDLSFEDIAKRFTGFKQELNPAIAALAEMKRLGLDTAGAIDQLSRVFDKRAFRTLAPLLQNFEELPRLTAEIALGNTSFDAAAKVMEALNAATQNFLDTMEVLFDSLGSEYLPQLTKMVKGLTALTQELVETNNRIRAVSGTGLAPTLGTAFISSAASTFMGTGTVGQRIVRGLVGFGAGGYAGTAAQKAAGEVGASPATAATAGATGAVVGGLLSGLAASVIYGFLERILRGGGRALLERKLIEGMSASGRVAGQVVGASAGLTGILGKLSASLRLLILGPFTKVGLALVGLTWVINRFVRDTSPETEAQERLQAVQKLYASAVGETERVKAQFDEYLREQDSGGRAGPTGKALDQLRDNLEAISDLLFEAVGRPVADISAVLDVLRVYKGRGLSGSARQELRSRLAEVAGGTTDQISEELLQQIQLRFLDVDSLRGGFQGMLRSDYLKVSDRLRSIGRDALNEYERVQVDFFETLRGTQVFEDILTGRPLTEQDLSGVMEDYLSVMSEARSKVAVPVEKAVDTLENMIQIFERDPSNFGVAEQLAAQITDAMEKTDGAVEGWVRALIERLREPERIIRGYGRFKRTEILDNEFRGAAAGLFEETLSAGRERQARDAFESLRQLFESSRSVMEADQLLVDPAFIARNVFSTDQIWRGVDRARQLQGALGGLGLDQPFPADPQAQQAFLEQVRGLVRQGVLEGGAGGLPTGRDAQLGQLARPMQRLGLSLDPGMPVTPAMTRSILALDREEELFNLRLEIERLRRESPSRLAGRVPQLLEGKNVFEDDGSNPLVRAANLRIQNLEEQLAAVRESPEDPKGAKEKKLQDLRLKLREEQIRLEEEILKNTADLETKNLQARQRTLDLEMQETNRKIADAMRRGAGDEIERLEADLARILEQRNATQNRLAVVQKTDTETMLEENRQRRELELQQQDRESQERRRQLALQSAQDRDRELAILEQEVRRHVDDAKESLDPDLLASKQQELQGILDLRYEAQMEIASLDERVADLAMRELESRKRLEDIARRREDAEARRSLISERASRIERAVRREQERPATGSVEADAFWQAARQTLPRQMRSEKAAAELGAVQGAMSALNSELVAARREFQAVRMEFGDTSDQARKAADQVEDLERQYEALAKQSGELKYELSQMNATFASEFSEVTLERLAASIDDLGGSLRNLGENIKQSALTLIDNWTDAVASFVANGFEMEGAADRMVAALQRIRDTELRLAEVQSNRARVEADIGAMAESVDDPLIRARVAREVREAQARAESLAREDVDRARRDAREESDRSGILGMTRGMFDDFATEVAKSVVKAGLLEILKNSFESLGGLLGKRGDTPANPLWVRIAEDPLTIGSKVAGEGGLMDKVFGFTKSLFGGGGEGGGISGLFSGITGFFGNLFKMSRGGIVPDVGPANVDRFPALLAPGEGVLTRNAVRMIGGDTVKQINDMARQPVRMAAGGIMPGPRPVESPLASVYNVLDRGAGRSSGNVVVHMQVQTPDVIGFRRSQGQIMADLQLQLNRARRNL